MYQTKPIQNYRFQKISAKRYEVSCNGGGYELYSEKINELQPPNINKAIV